MSQCECKRSRHFRITGEFVADDMSDIGHMPVAPHGTIGYGDDIAPNARGERFVRIRCAECGGKVGWISIDLLRLLGLQEEQLDSENFDENEEIVITIDLA